jgi:hypothetical protein
MPYQKEKAKLKSDFIDLGEELKSGGMTIPMGSEESEESPKYHCGSPQRELLRRQNRRVGHLHHPAIHDRPRPH